MGGTLALVQLAPLIPLAELAVVVAALAVAVFGDKLMNMFFGAVEEGVGWIPFAGRFLKKPVSWLHRHASDAMVPVVAGLEELAAQSWDSFTYLLRETGEAMWDLTKLGARIEWLITTRYSLAALAARLGWNAAKGTFNAAKGLVTVERVRVIETIIKAPTTGKIGAAIQTALRPLRARVRTLETHVRALELAPAAPAVTYVTNPVRVIRTQTKVLERGYHALRERVKTLETRTTGLLAAGLVVGGLGRIGAGWIQCRNWNRIGRSVCRLPTDLIDSLFGLGVPLLLASDLCLVARLFQSAAHAAVPALEALVAVADAAVNCSDEGAPPPMVLHTTQMPATAGLTELPVF